jgi:hypothetical protein
VRKTVETVEWRGLSFISYDERGHDAAQGSLPLHNTGRRTLNLRLRTIKRNEARVKPGASKRLGLTKFGMEKPPRGYYPIWPACHVRGGEISVYLLILRAHGYVEMLL